MPPDQLQARVIGGGQIMSEKELPQDRKPLRSFLPVLLLRRLSVSSEMAPEVEVFFRRTVPVEALPGLLSMSSLLALLS